MSSRARLAKRWLTKTRFGVARDLQNRRRYGSGAPRYAQRIWVDPTACVTTVSPSLSRADSGTVRGGDRDRRVVMTDDDPKACCSRIRWSEGVPWKGTGICQHMLAVIDERGACDGMASLEKLVERYRRLDELIATFEREQRIWPNRHLNPRDLSRTWRDLHPSRTLRYSRSWVVPVPPSCHGAGPRAGRGPRPTRSGSLRRLGIVDGDVEAFCLAGAAWRAA